MKNTLPYSVNYEIAIFGKKINWKVQHNVRQHQSKTLEYLKIQESLRSENLTEYYYICKEQKQPSRDVLRKRCSENMQQIYWITPIANCDLNKVAKQLYWDHTSAWVFSCKFTSYFQSTFFTEHLRATNSEDRDLSVTSIKRDVGRCFLVNFWGKNCEKAPF